MNSISLPDKAVQESTDVNCISTTAHMDVEECEDAGNIEDDNAVCYIAGYICSIFLKRHKCIECKNILTLDGSQKILSQSHQIFTYFKAFDDDFGNLSVPTDEVYLQFRNWESKFCKYFKDNCHRKNLKRVMKEYIFHGSYFSLCSQEQFTAFLNLYIQARIKWSVRFLNKSQFLDPDFKRKLRILNNN